VLGQHLFFILLYVSLKLNNTSAHIHSSRHCHLKKQQK